MKAFSFTPKIIHRISLLLLLLFPFVLVGFACENSVPPESLSSKGDFSKCVYTDDLSDPGYSSAVIYYPCEKNGEPFAASTLTGGWINTKEDMSWIADHLVTHGYIIIAMTPNNNMGDNEEWEGAHKAGLGKLISENQRSDSPIRGLVDIGHMQIMGFSKGGGGALLAAADMGAKVKSTQALAPYMDHQFDLDGIRSATVCYSGTEDLIASHSVVTDIFNTLPQSIDRAMVVLDKAAHLDWMNDGNYQDRFKAYITAWMNVHLKDDAGYKKHIKNTQDWLRDFQYYDAGSKEKSGGCD